MSNPSEAARQRARELIAGYAVKGDLESRIAAALSAKDAEIERLKRGDFRPEEFQNLCHNTNIQKGFEAFADGCEQYQTQIFGRCRKGTAE